MAFLAKVTSLEGDVTAVPHFEFDETIALEQPSQVLLQVAPEDVAVMRRMGDDLLIELNDGRIIQVADFYGEIAEELPSKLFLTGAEDQLVPVELGSLSDGIVNYATFYPVSEYAVEQAAFLSSSAAVPTGLASAGLAGAGVATAAVAASALGSSSESDVPFDPDVPGDPDEPDVPGDPDEPDVPDDPDEPDVPGDPDESDVPDDPDEPDVPGDPDEPDVPGDPDEPDVPGDPDEPDVPGDPDEPDVPGDPDEPDVPGDPDEPDVPGDPDEPDVPGDPDEPDVPGDPDEPSAPPAPALRLSNDTGSADDDGITRDGTISVSNLVEGASWEYSLNGGTTWLAGQGSRFTLPEGEYPAGQVRARQTSPEGVTGESALLGRMSIDETPPEAPTLALANDTGEIDGVTSDGAVRVGNLEPGARWSFSLDGGATWQPGSGDRFVLAEGDYAADEVQVRQTDAAGNISQTASLGAVTVEPDPAVPREPETPPAPVLTLANDTSEGDITTSDGTIMVSNLLQGARWEYSLDGGQSWRAGEGDRFVLPEGDYAQGQVQARQFGESGNVGPAGSLEAVVVDMTPPPPPSAWIMNDTGEVLGITNDGRVGVGDVEDNTTWWYSVDGGNSWTRGDDSASFMLEEGVYATRQVLLRQVDVAGNESSLGNLGAVIIDTTPPEAPSMALAQNSVALFRPAMAFSEPVAFSETIAPGETMTFGPARTFSATMALAEEAEDIATVVLDGTIVLDNLEPGTFWSYSLDGGASWLRGSGDRFILAKGRYSAGQIQARQTDGAGNVSEPTEFGPVVVDLIIDDPQDPTLPAIPTLTLAIDTGELDGITSNGTVIVGGLVENATWEFSLDGGQSWQVGVGDRFVLAEGDYAAGRVLVRQSDAEGATSGIRTLGSVLIDTTAPASPSVELANDTGAVANITADGTVLIGKLESNAYWQFSFDGGLTWQPGVGDRLILAEGDYTAGQLQIRQVDQAGNISESVAVVVTVDLTPPQAPILTLSLNGPVPGAAFVNVGGLEAGALWEYSLDGGQSWTAGTGRRFELEEGSFEQGQVQVRQTDGAGNVSAATALSPVVIDITPPETPELVLADGGGITGDGTVTVEGLESGASWEYSLDGGLSWAVGEGTDFVLAEGTYSAGQILVRQIDAVGNVSAPAALGDIVVDTTPPPAPLLTLASGVDENGVTTDGTVLLGNLEPSARWQYTLDGGQSWQTGVGDFFVLPAGVYGDGQIQARQIDAAGNVSTVTSFGSVTVDLTLEPPVDPEAPLTPTLVLAVDTGTVDGITRNGSVNVEGLVEGASWEYSLDGGDSWRAGSGTSFTLTEGVYTTGQVVVRQSEGGLTSGTSTLGAVTVDLTAPVAPSVILANDTGDIDGITRDGTLAISDLEPAAFWEISLDGGATWQRGTGARFILEEGDYAAGDIRVRQTDGAGNVSDATSLGAVVVAVEPPAAPSVELDGPITNDGTLTLGNLLDQGRWEYSLDSGATWQAGQGDSVVIAEGRYAAGQIQVRQVDGADNPSAPVLLDAVVIDLTPPSAPTVTLAGQAAITNDGTVEVGNLEPGASWEYSLDSGQSWLVGVGSGFVLAEGEYRPDQIQVRQIDAAGNVGKPAALGALVVDTTPPEAPTLTLIGEPIPPSGLIADGTVQLGNLDPNTRWEYSLDGGDTWLPGSGERFVLPSDSYAEGQIQARQIDAAGNESPSFALGPVTVDPSITQPTDPDTGAPPAPSIALALDSGDVDGVTNNGQIQVGGLVENATWQYSFNGGASWFRGFDTHFNLPEGRYLAGQVLVRQTASDGRTSSTATLGSVTVDTTAPLSPTGTLRLDTGELDGISRDGTLLIGNLESGARWEISLDGGADWIQGVGSQFILPEGRYESGVIRLRQTDAAGNISEPTQLGAIEIDNVLPDSPTLSRLGGAISNDGVVRVSELEDGARWEYSLDGGASWVPGRGTSFTVPEGSYMGGDVQVRQTDGAGNMSAPTPLDAFVIDLSPPLPPALTLVQASAITNDGRIEVSGLEQGATWQYSLNGGTTWRMGAGSEFTLPEGDYAAGSVQVRQLDAAGNIGAPASLQAVTVDTTPPATPSLTLANDTGEPDDGITADGTVLVDGLEPGGHWEISLNGGASWTRGLADRFELPAGQYGAGQVQVRQFDAAGNVSPPAELGALTIDLTVDLPEEPNAPATPTLSLASDTGQVSGLTSDGTVNVGDLIDGAGWEYSLNEGNTWLQGTGSSFTLAEGVYAAGQVLVRQTDGGLTSGASTLGAVTVDSTAPVTPSVTLLNDTGTLDGVTNDGTLTIGNLETDTYWEISLNGGATWQEGSGERFVLPAGDYAADAILVRQTDGAGNVSTVGSAEAVSVVTTPPAAPSVTLAGNSLITNDPMANVASLQEGATWQYSLDGGATWQTGSNDSFEVPEGRYAAGAIQVRQTDGAGNVSSPALLGMVTIDLTAPEPPNAALLDARPITNDGAVDVTGLEVGATWQYSLDGGTTWRAGTGSRFTLAEGDYAAGDVQVRQIDAAGNEGMPSELDAVRVDTSAPVTPGMALALDGDVINDSTVSVTGIEENAVWEYSLDGGQLWQTGTGDSFALPDGAYPAEAVQVRQTDVAGNESLPAVLGAVVIDTADPTAPTLTLANDTGTVGDGITTDGTLLVGGLESNATWQYSLDGGDTWQNGTGDRFILPEDSYGPRQIQVRQTDAAGNTSLPAVLGAVVIDTVNPTAPTLTLANDTGTVGDGITADGTLLVGGLESNATWEYSLDGGATWQSGTGDRFILPEASYGPGQVRVLQIDAAGNASAPTAFGPITVSLTLDDTPDLEAPTLALEEDTGALGNDGITSNGTVIVGGLIEGGSWQYSLDGGATWINGAGQSFLLPEGSYTGGQVQVRQSDAGGRTSGERALAAVTVDTTAPASPALSLVNDTGVIGDGITSDGTVQFSGLESGARWEYSLDGGANWLAGSGTGFVLPAGDYPPGQVLARQFDRAGNESQPGELGRVVVDVTSPGGENGSDAPFIELPDLTRGFINADAAQEGIELGVLLPPGAQAGDRLIVKISLSRVGDETPVAIEDLYYEVTPEEVATGIMRVALDGDYADGRYSVAASITDLAGNVSADSNAIGFVLDTTPPNADTTRLLVDPITADNIINIAESGRNVEISGRVDGEFRVGDVLNITINGGEYTTHIGAGGAFAVPVLGSLLAGAAPPEVAFELLARDEAGNVGIIESSVGYEVALDRPGVTVDSLTGDNVINGQNIANGLVVTGSVDGAPEGARVTLSIDGATFEGLVEGGRWRVSVPAAFLRDISGDTFDVVASVANAAGNVGASAPSAVLIDDTPPTAAINISSMLIGAGDEALVTFTFSEAITGFTLDDVVVQGGSLANLTRADGVTWTADFLPGASGPASLSLSGGSYTDLAGNPGQAANLGGITVDVDPPVLSSIGFAVDGRPLTSAETTEVTFTFSEAITGLTLDDFTVSGGRLSNLTSSNGGSVWTATFKPDGVAFSAAITLADGRYTDLAGNPGSGGTSPTLPIVILQPVLIIEAAEDGWINGFEASGSPVQVGFDGLPVSAGDEVVLELVARAGGDLAEGTAITTVTYVLSEADVANHFALFTLELDAEYTFQPAAAQVRIGDSAASAPVEFVIDTVPPGRAVEDDVEVAGNGILLDTLLSPGEGLRLRIGDGEDSVQLLDAEDYPGLLVQNTSGQYVLDLFVLAVNLQELLGSEPLDLRSLNIALSTYDQAGNESNVVALNDFNLLGPAVSLLDFTGSLVGLADPGASVAVEVRLGGVTQTITVSADANGAFSVDLLADPRLNFSLDDLLRASVSAVATDAQDSRSFSPATANLADLLPAPISLLDAAPLTNAVVSGAGVAGALASLALPEGGRLAATLDVGGLGSVGVPVTTASNGVTSVDLAAALAEAVSTFNLLGGVSGLLSGRGAALTLEYTSPQGGGGAIDVGLVGSSLATLTFGSVRERSVIGTEEADVLIVGAGQSVQALGGDDLIVLRSDAFGRIDGGEGVNTLLVEGRLTLDLADLGRMSNIQRLNLGNSASTVTLDAETANALAGDGGTLQVIGGAANALVIAGAAAPAGTTVIDGTIYQQVTLGDTTLLVNQGLALDFVPTIHQTAGYIVSGGGEAGAAVAVQVGSTTYNTQVDEQGEWRLVLDQPTAAGSQIRAVVGGETTETVSVPASLAAPTGLQIRTPLLAGLLTSFLEGSAAGAQTVRLDVYQDDLFTSLRSTTINVSSNGTFSVGTTLLSNLLDSTTSLLVGSEGVNVGFTAVRSNGTHSTTEVVNFGTAESVFANTLGAITNTLGGVLGGTRPLPVTNSVYEGSDSADIVQGSTRPQTFVTEDGNDVVISIGGADVIDLGAGDDVVVLRHTQFARIDGGDGFDIVALGTGIDLNLTSPTLGEIRNVERISLGRGNGANRLTVNRSELVELTDEANVLQITGDSQDRVDLSGGGWSRAAAPQTVDGVVFNEYVNQDAILLIEQGINVMEVT